MGRWSKAVKGIRNRITVSEKNTTLKMKILRGYLILILLVFLLVIILLSCFLHNYVNNNIYTNMVNHNQQIDNSIDYHFNDIITLSEYPYIDKEVLTILRKEHEEQNTAWLSRLADISALNNLIYKHVFYMNDHINSVWLVPENLENSPAVKTRGSINNNYKITDEDWFETVYNGKGKPYILGVHENKGSTLGGEIVSVARSIVDPENGSYLGMIVINTLVEDLATLWYTGAQSDNVIALADKNNRLIMQEDNNRTKGFREYLTKHGQELKPGQINHVRIDGSRYYAVATRLTCMEGKIFQLYSADAATEGFRLLIGGIMAGAVLAGILLIFISYAVADSVTKPVYQLVSSMKEVEEGNLQTQSREFEGELQVLSQTFNRMVRRMDDMFQELQHKEKQKREMELLALQAQINPHFMYNTLNSIRCMAEMQGADSVVRMLDAMIHILHYAAEGTGEIVSIEKELAFIKNYIQIINFRYFDRFSFYIQAGNTTYQYGTLRFILQPLVENAVLHGFDAEDLHAVIEIKIFEQNDDLVIEVTDNGKGMDERHCEEILKQGDRERKSLNQIGLYNVNQRIKLSFGEAYGITLMSKIGCYTKAVIRIPKIPEADYMRDRNEG